MKYKSQGDAGMAKPVIIGKHFIYLHTNIEKHVDEEGREYYKYDVEKLSLEEAIKHLMLENIKLKKALGEIGSEVFK